MGSPLAVRAEGADLPSLPSPGGDTAPVRSPTDVEGGGLPRPAPGCMMDGSWATRSSGGITLRALQGRIRDLYGAKDAARGDAATFLWLAEEFGELATALRSGTHEELALEMADVLAWLATLANVRGVDLEAAVRAKYGDGCPGCGATPCAVRPGREALASVCDGSRRTPHPNPPPQGGRGLSETLPPCGGG